MPTPLNGNKLGVYIDHDDAGSSTPERLVALSTNASLSFSNATIEVSSKKTNTGGTLLDTGTSLTNSIAGASSWSISCEGLLDLSTPSSSTDEDGTGTTEHGFANLMTMAIARTKVKVVFKDASAASGTGQELYGTGFIESIEASGGVDDFATYSVTFKGDGDLTMAGS